MSSRSPESIVVFRRLLRDSMDLNIKNSTIPGVSVAVGRGNRLLFAESVGLRDTKRKSAFTVDTPIHIASQTKMFTSIACSQLESEGLLDVHERISEYLPQLGECLPAELHTLTPYDVLTHRSRLPRDFHDDERVLPLLDAVVASLERTGINPSPAYSNVAYAILAHVVSFLRGEPFVDVVKRRIIDELKLSKTGWGEASVDEPSKQYGPLIEGCRNELADRTSVQGATGIWSTPTDMCRVAAAFLGCIPPVMPVAAARVSSIVHWGPGPDGREFGRGLESRWMANRRWFGHTGGAPGFVSGTYFCPESQFVFSVALNARDERALQDLTEAIACGVDMFGELELDPQCFQSPFDRMFGSYCGDLGYSTVVPTPMGPVLLDPSQWNMFRSPHSLRIASDGSVRVGGNDFSLTNTKLSVDGDEGRRRLRIGIHEVYPRHLPSIGPFQSHR